MKKTKKYQNGGSLFLTMPTGGGVPAMPVMAGQLPEFQLGSNTGIMQNTLRDVQHYYGKNLNQMQTGGDMEDESGATNSFYTNKLNGFINKVRGIAQDNLEKNIQEEAMEQFNNRMAQYGMEMPLIEAQYGMQTGNYMQNYDPTNLNAFAKAYSNSKSFSDSLQDFAKMNRIIQPNQKYTKEKTKWGLGFMDKFKEDNPWIYNARNADALQNAGYFEEGGTLIPMFQGDDGPSTVWNNEEMAYIKSLPHDKQLQISQLPEGQAKQMVQDAVTQSKKQPAAPKAPVAPKQQTTPNQQVVNPPAATQQTGTANNTVVNTATSGKSETPNKTTNEFEGWSFHRMPDGTVVPVDPYNQIHGYGYTGAQSVYTPQNQEYRTYDILDKHRFTPGFRKAMQSGELDDAALLGALPHIEYRKALFPKNRNKEIKSISWQYGKLSGDPFANQGAAPGQPLATGTSKTTTTPNIQLPAIDSPAIQSAYNWNFRPGQNNFAPSGGWQDYPGTMEKPQVGPLNTDNIAPEAPFQSGYVPGSSEYPNVPGYGNMPTQSVPAGNPSVAGNITTQTNTAPASTPFYNTNYDWNTVQKENADIIKKIGQYEITKGNALGGGLLAYTPLTTNPEQFYNWQEGRTGNVYDYSGHDQNKAKFKGFDANALPKDLREVVLDQSINQSTDPRLTMLISQGLVDDADRYNYDNAKITSLFNDPKNQEALSKAYNEDPNQFINTYLDQRQVTYGRTNKKGFDQNTFNSLSPQEKEKYLSSLQVADAYNYTWAPRIEQYRKQNGGSLHKFMKKYQGINGSNQVGSSPLDMNLNEYFNMRDSILDDDTEFALRTARFNNMDNGIKAPTVSDYFDRQNQDKLDFTGSAKKDGFSIEDPFYKKTKYSREKTMRDPWKAIRNINLATGFFNADENANALSQLKEATQSSNLFYNVPNNLGMYNALTGKYMGPQGAQPPVMNTGYAQEGGSMYNNLKQGDEVYLTQTQIDELLKRGVKLSYLD